MKRSDFHSRNVACLELVILGVAVKLHVPPQVDLLGSTINRLHVPCSRTPERLVQLLELMLPSHMPYRLGPLDSQISFGAVLLKGDYPHPMAHESLCLRLTIFVT